VKLPDHRAQALAGVARVAVVPGQPRPASGGLDIGLVHPDGRVRQAVQAGHVVLVHMAQDDGIDAVQRRSDVVGHQRRVKRHAQVRTGHDHLVAVRVLAVAVAKEHGHGADLLLGYFRHQVWG
jgi:hypothetical protein